MILILLVTLIPFALNTLSLSPGSGSVSEEVLAHQSLEKFTKIKISKEFIQSSHGEQF